jgi:hypothetical protein
MGAGVRRKKAKKMQNRAAEQTTRKLKGRNKVKKIPRRDRTKQAAG